MWWSRTQVSQPCRRRLAAGAVTVALALLGPAGCGFRPLYGTPGGNATTAEADLSQIRIDSIKDRLGQQLRNALVQRMSPRGEAADYKGTLRIELTESISDLGYRKDTFATIGNLTLSATIRLTWNGTAIMGDTISTLVSFDYLGPRYASVVMERDAEERAVTQLAESIQSQTGAALARYKSNPNDPRYRPAATDDPFAQASQATDRARQDSR